MSSGRSGGRQANQPLRRFIHPIDVVDQGHHPTGRGPRSAAATTRLVGLGRSPGSTKLAVIAHVPTIFNYPGKLETQGNPSHVDLVDVLPDSTDGGCDPIAASLASPRVFFACIHATVCSSGAQKCRRTIRLPTSVAPSMAADTFRRGRHDLRRPAGRGRLGENFAAYRLCQTCSSSSGRLTLGRRPGAGSGLVRAEGLANYRRGASRCRLRVRGRGFR